MKPYITERNDIFGGEPTPRPETELARYFSITVYYLTLLFLPYQIKRNIVQQRFHIDVQVCNQVYNGLKMKYC